MNKKTHQSSRLVMEFPQPTRPVNSYTDDTSSSSTSLNSINDENPISKWHHKPAQHDYYVAPAAAAMTTIITEEEEDREDIEKLLGSAILEICKKLPEKIRHKLVKELEDVQGQMISTRRGLSSQENLTKRGLEGGSDDQIKERLERFKIRTLNPTGEVRKDDETKR